MRKVTLVILALLLALPVYAQLTAGPDNSPKVGEAAPDFPIPAAQRGQPAGALKDFQGKKNVLLMFFPGAFTPGCTREFTEAGQEHDKFTALNIEMLGISADLPGALAQFKTSVGAKNAFVSDRSLAISTKYDAATANNSKRYYFLIDQTGKILWKSSNNSLIPTDQLLTQVTQALGK
ncbi:MAG TPA: redoxin domain-containing protein [Terriglobia bacterium]|nr:redoxin domain-containing protein [Terriglobia bacterium]